MLLNQRFGQRPLKGHWWQQWLAWIQCVSLATWFGSMVFVSFIGAPTTFQLIEDTRTAGTVVGGMLDKVYLMSYGVCAIMCCVAVIQAVLGHISGLRLAGLVMTLVMGVGMNVYAREVVARKMAEIRKSIDQVSLASDQEQLRRAFDMLHRYSVWLMGGSILVGLVLIYIVIVVTQEPRETNRWRI
jgi:hypothetical protein